MKSKKKYGQNFLVDGEAIKDLLEAGDICRRDAVLEIGAGTGALTKALAEEAGRVIAVEVDKDLIPLLEKNLADFNNVEIVNRDILSFLEVADKTASVPQKIIGSIPYQITSPLVHRLVGVNGWQTAVLLVQKEVAEKITARPPRAAYLSNFVQAFADVKLIRTVPKEAFWPRPKVDGAVIKLKIKNQKSKLDPGNWGRFLHRGFTYPRKMLKNSFAEGTLKSAKISGRRRPANLTLAEWVRLYQRRLP